MAVITQKSFGTLPDGREALYFVMTNAKKHSVSFTEFGATVVEINVPDRDGNLNNISMGHNTLEEYVQKDACFGAICGRVANRIDNRGFTLNGERYELYSDELGVSLHGGLEGFHKKLWKGEAKDGKLSFTYVSPDGEEGYPGELTVTVTYGWSDNDELEIVYEYSSDKDTLANLTNHTYFNLEGHNAGYIGDHMCKILASKYTPLLERLCPDGTLAPVEGTPYDFREFTAIGPNLEAEHPQIAIGGGIDINFAPEGEGFRLMASVYDPKSGRAMDCSSDLPGIQLYTANFLKDNRPGRGGGNYVWRGAFCLETQYYPNAVNTPGFTVPLVKAGENGYTRTMYRFYTV